MTQVEELLKIYSEAEKKLKAAIVRKSMNGSFAVYERSALRQVRRIIADLKKKTPSLTGDIIRAAYEKGAREAAAEAGEIARFSRLDIEQIDLLSRNMAEDLAHAMNIVGRRIEDEFRRAGLEMTAQKNATLATRREAQKDLERRLQGLDAVQQPDGMIGVRYRNGRVVTIEHYAAMVARTTPAEAQNKAKFVKAAEFGYDLVKCTKYAPTCDVCAMYQGRVYALTREAANGKYFGLKFPYLYDTALYRGYEVIHPNCRHRFAIYAAEAHSKEELRKASAESMQPFEDNRSDRERKAYAAEQNFNRIQRANVREWQAMRANSPNEAYKTFSGFLSGKRSQSEKYKTLKNALSG